MIVTGCQSDLETETIARLDLHLRKKYNVANQQTLTRPSHFTMSNRVDPRFVAAESRMQLRLEGCVKIRIVMPEGICPYRSDRVQVAIPLAIPQPAALA